MATARDTKSISSNGMAILRPMSATRFTPGMRMAAKAMATAAALDRYPEATRRIAGTFMGAGSIRSGLSFT